MTELIKRKNRQIKNKFHGLDYKWLVLIVVLGGTFISILDSTVVNVAIPAIQSAFNVKNYSDITWVVTGYMLAQALIIPTSGWISDRFGLKKSYLITLFLFTFASGLCGLAWNLPSLIVFRLLQGLGGGALMPLGMSLILTTFGAKQINKVMGYFGVPLVLAPILGPILGGLFVQTLSFRYIFWINVPIGIVCFFAARKLLKESDKSKHLKLDVLGVLTGTPAVGLLMFGIDRSTYLGWTSATVLGCLITSSILFTFFIYHQLHTKEPLLHLELFKNRIFSSSMIVSLFVAAGFFGGMLLLPLFLQQVHGYSALTTGLILGPQAIAAAICMPFAGKISDKIGSRIVVSVGLLVLATSSFVLFFLGPTTSIFLIFGALILRGFASGLTMMPAMAAALQTVPKRSQSRASSITNTVQRAGSSIAIAVVITFLSAQAIPATQAAASSCTPSAAVLQTAPAHVLTNNFNFSQPASGVALCQVLQAKSASASLSPQGSSSSAVSSGSPVFDQFIASYKNDVLSSAFDRTFLFVGILALLGLIPAAFLKNKAEAKATIKADKKETLESRKKHVESEEFSHIPELA